MARDTAQYANEAQDIARSVYGAAQSMAETQFHICQQLGGVQQEIFNQAVEAANEQLQLVGRIRDPREFASAQADLVKSHGQRYVKSISRVVDIVAEAWQECGDRLEQAMNNAGDKTRGAASSKKP